MSQFVTLSKKKFNKEQTQRFKTKVHGRTFQGFVVKTDQGFFAYQNLCRHLPVTLDLNDNNFLTYDQKHLQCHMHGAVYDMESGLCTAGPCEGQRLLKLPIEEEAKNLLIKIPDDF